MKRWFHRMTTAAAVLSTLLLAQLIVTQAAA